MIHHISRTKFQDNPPIGLILSRHKDELLVEYATTK